MIKSLKDFLKETYLYHATYKAHAPSINKHGLKANSDHKNWEDSKKGRVYLAKSPEVAHSYAETSDDAPDHHYNSGITVYKIRKKHLDKNKLHKDSNVKGDGDTHQYHGDIPSHHLQVHSHHSTT